MVQHFTHPADPLTDSEWNRLAGTVRRIGNATVARRLINVAGPLGAGTQTVPTETMIGITEGSIDILGLNGRPVQCGLRQSDIVPIISKDFIVHWRDLAEARRERRLPSISKAAAAASTCARTEDKLVLFGQITLGLPGLTTVEGRHTLSGLRWSNPGEAFANFTRMTEILLRAGHRGPFAAVVHPGTYAAMHRVLAGSKLLEIAHVRNLLSAGVLRSALLAPRTGLVISTGRDNFELVVAIDTSVAFLGAKRMNLPFRVFKAVYLRILRSDAICTFS